jgi:hypothetical protein
VPPPVVNNGTTFSRVYKLPVVEFAVVTEPDPPDGVAGVVLFPGTIVPF